MRFRVEFLFFVFAVSELLVVCSSASLKSKDELVESSPRNVTVAKTEVKEHGDPQLERGLEVRARQHGHGGHGHGQGHSGKKKRSKKKKKGHHDMMSKIMPMMIMPFMISTGMIPMMLMNLKMMLLKSAFLAKIGIILMALNMFRSRIQGGGVFSHNIHQNQNPNNLYREHYGYSGDEEYGAYVHRKR